MVKRFWMDRKIPLTCLTFKDLFNFNYIEKLSMATCLSWEAVSGKRGKTRPALKDLIFGPGFAIRPETSKDAGAGRGVRQVVMPAGIMRDQILPPAPGPALEPRELRGKPLDVEELDGAVRDQREEIHDRARKPSSRTS